MNTTTVHVVHTFFKRATSLISEWVVGIVFPKLEDLMIFCSLLPRSSVSANAGCYLTLVNSRR
ncbi:MAG: hypothetical protein RL518_1061 [Pseudomonadota bacterium]